MEKLSKLLNEYLESKEKDIQQFMNITALMTQSDSKLYQIYIISKQFWFIKWLVESDKIDFSLIPNKIKEIWIPMKINWEIKYWFDSSDYYWLLMLLSISDTPIEDLISYLK